MKRVWVRCELWEELKHNMWGSVDSKAWYLQKAIEFTGNHKLYGFYMIRVVNEWENSCLNALTDDSLNQKAWVGHAACALAIGCPEYITRQAWGYLSNVQRELANIEAKKAIQYWNENYTGKSELLHRDVAQPMLF